MSVSKQAPRPLEPSLGRAFLGAVFALVSLTAMAVLVFGGALLLLLDGLSLVRP